LSALFLRKIAAKTAAKALTSPALFRKSAVFGPN
jgi:hypothetical protein